MGFFFTNLAADIYLPKMAAGLLSRSKRQFHPPEIIGIHFSYITKIPGDTLQTKMPAELPSTEQRFTETSRLMPLCIDSFIWISDATDISISMASNALTVKGSLHVKTTLLTFML